MSYFQKDNVNIFSMITNKNEIKTMTKHISCNCECKFISTTCNSNQKWDNETCQCECKNYHKCKKDYSSNPSICIYENSEYLKSIADTSVIVYDEIIDVMDIASIKVTNNIATSTLSINSDGKNERYKIVCYILHTVLLVIILLLIIAIMCYLYAKHRSKQKGIDALTI